jgi:cobalt-zinc-cadmium efflux system outer membrane protein
VPRDGDSESTLATDDEFQSVVWGRPDVMAAEAEVAAAGAALALARASLTPDIQAGPVYSRDESQTTFWGVQAQLELKVVNTGGTVVVQRMAELRQKQTALWQLRDKALQEALAAVQRYQRARRVVEQSRADFAAALPAELRQVEDQFNAGQIDILRVLAARASLIQARRAYLDSLNELSQAAADVTATTGLFPQAIVSPVEPAPPAQPVPR